MPFGHVKLAVIRSQVVEFRSEKKIGNIPGTILDTKMCFFITCMVIIPINLQLT